LVEIKNKLLIYKGKTPWFSGWLIKSSLSADQDQNPKKQNLSISFMLKACDGKCKSGLIDCDNGGNPICIPESFTWTCDAKCLSLDVPCDGKCSEEKEFTIVLDKNGNEICMYQGFVNFQFWQDNKSD
jgi:hypothetical protein